MADSESAFGKLCYKSSTGIGAGFLTYKKNDGSLVYKSTTGYLTVYVSWSSADRDLDICGYLEGLPDVKGGWSWPYCDKTYEDENYFFRHYGDDTSYGGREKFLILLKPWDNMELSHKLRIYLNYYGSTVSYVCTVTAIAGDGTTVTKTNVPCGANFYSKATPGRDPYVVIDINEHG